MTRFSAIDLQTKKNKGEKIVAVTAYDVAFAKCIDPYVDLVLVGDSLGMVIQGKETTLEVSVEEMIYHTRCVHRGLKRAHLCVDMPFLSYQLSLDRAIENAGRLLQAGAQSVKLEGGEEVANIIEKLTQFGIPVIGHLGMTPQSIHKWGGYRVQGREEHRKDQLLRDAKILEEKGAQALVLESVSRELAAEITQHAKIPTIGIGAGSECDGQILVIYDLLGMDPNFEPTFLKKYSNLSQIIGSAVETYATEVRASLFPSEKQSYK